MKAWKELGLQALAGAVVGILVCTIFMVARPATSELSIPSMPGPVVDGLQLSYLRDDAAGKCFAYFKGHPESLIETLCAGVRW